MLKLELTPIRFSPAKLYFKVQCFNNKANIVLGKTWKTIHSKTFLTRSPVQNKKRQATGFLLSEKIQILQDTLNAVIQF